MDLEIFKEKLNQSLGVIEPLTKKNINLPVLSNILIEAEKNFLKLSATNLETSVIWWILTKIKKEGKVCLPATFLRSLVSFIKEDKISISSENNSLILESKDEKNQIQGINPEDFPIIPKMQTEDFIEIEGERLNQGLSQIANIPSVSQIRPEISGVYFSFKKDKMYLVGTDSFRLAEKVIDLKEKVKNDFSFILPQLASRELLNILSLKSGKLKIYATPNQVLFEWLGEETDYPQIHFSSRLIEGEYPNYQEIIPKKYTAQVILDKDEFLNQIKKAGLFSGKISEVKLTLIPKEKRMKIFSQSTEIGKNEAFIPVNIESGDKEEENSFNYRFLIDGLVNIRGSEVILSFSGKETAASVRPVGDNTYIYILMPIKAT